MPLSELLAAEGLEGRIDEVVEWARARADEILANEALDEELAGVLGGNGVVAHGPAVPAYAPRDHTAPGNTQPGVPMPQPPMEPLPRAPLPPVPQRPDLAAKHGEDAEDLEMLDEDDLELVEDLGGDDDDDAEGEAHGDNGVAAEGGGEGAGEAEHPPGIGAGESSPEWKRALADAQGDEA